MSAATVVVTGAASGIGAATSALFAERGYRVFGLDLREADSAGGVPIFACDVSSEESVAAAARRVAGATDTLAGLINVAGIGLFGPTAAETAVADFDRVLAVNLRGPFLTTRALLPLLRAGRGSVVNVSSVHAVASAPGHSAYASSKAALLALTRVTALEERANGVRVNAILPGSINTGMTVAALASGQDAGLRIAPELIATAEQAASAIFLLTQPDASFVTGACLVADGGLLAQLT